MSVDVTTEIVINRPLLKIAAYVMDPDNAPEWYVNIKSVEWQTDRPAMLGTRISFVAHFLGRRLAYTYEIVEFAAGRNLKMRTAQGPFPMETSYAFEDAPGGATWVTLRNRGTPTGFSRLVAPFMATAMRRANKKDLATLKRLMEVRT